MSLMKIVNYVNKELFGKTNMKDTYGTEAVKLHRKDSPETSVEAANSIADLTSELEEIVFKIIRDFGDVGCISDDVRKVAKDTYDIHSYSSITARYKSLGDKGYITYTGGKRAGNSGRNQRIMVAGIADG